MFCCSMGNLLIVLVLTSMKTIQNETGSGQEVMPFVYFCEVSDVLKLKNVVFLKKLLRNLNFCNFQSKV